MVTDTPKALSGGRGRKEKDGKDNNSTDPDNRHSGTGADRDADSRPDEGGRRGRNRILERDGAK